MSRYFLRIAVAVLSFAIGLFGVWASGYWKSFEDFVVDRFGDEPNLSLNYVNTEPNYSTEKKAIYTQIIKEFIKTEDNILLISDKTTEFPFWLDLTEPDLSERTSSTKKYNAFVKYYIKDFPQLKGITLEDYFSKNIEPQDLSDLPEIVSVPHLDSNTATMFYVQHRIIKFSRDENNYLVRHIMFSNIGFDSNLTQAFVFVSLKDGNYIRHQFFLLHKTQDAWVIEKRKIIIEGYFGCK